MNADRLAEIVDELRRAERGGVHPPGSWAERYVEDVTWLVDDADWLLAEVRRLKDGIRQKCEAWDRDDPAQLAFVVVADFRTLLDGEEGRNGR